MSIARDASDRRWAVDGERFGWLLPPRAPWLLRLPGVRHVRAYRLAWRIERHYAAVPGIRSGYDEWCLYAIARGWC